MELTDEATRLRDASARIGTTLCGKWHLDAFIAIGGMGAVYEATHRNGMRGAVKILDPRLGQSLSCRRRFLREGKLANRVNHAGAVRVLDDDEAEDGSAYLVMELLQGSTLDELAASSGGKLGATAVVEYGLQILDTLVEAAASGIVHRDIKPENLFLTHDGIVKILDFGIAGMVSKDGRSTVTHAGETIGTPAFMAPEQARGRWELVDHQSDLYSLGASLFALMTGKLVHDEAATPAELLVLAITRNAPSLRQVMPDAPEALVRAIDGALARDKAKRWADAAAMRLALQQAHVALTRGIRAETPRSFAPMSPAPERSRRAGSWAPVWLLVGFALLVVGGATFVSSVVAPRALTGLSIEQEPAPPPPAPSPTAMPSTQPSSVATPASVPGRLRRYDPIYDRRY